VVADVLRALRGTVRLQVRARQGERNAALLERVGSALAAAPHCVAFNKTSYDWWVSVVDDRGPIVTSDTLDRQQQALQLQRGVRTARAQEASSDGCVSRRKTSNDVGGVASGKLWFSVCPRGLLSPFSEAKLRQLGGGHEVCRAVWKLREALQETEVAAVLTRRGGVARALDLGAAPGGWTSVLAERCSDVVAVDPADLNPDVLALRGVRHVRLQAEVSEVV